LCRRQSLASLVWHGLLITPQSRTVVHNVIVGSISLAVPGPKAFQNASTAQEVVVVTPTATDFEFRVGSQSDLPPFIAYHRNSAGVTHRQCLPVHCRSYQVSRTSPKTPFQMATHPSPHRLRFSASNLSLHNHHVRHSYSTDSRYTAPFSIAPTTIFYPPRP
jgi:hypothetical protein